MRELGRLVALVASWLLALPGPGLVGVGTGPVQREFPVRGETSYGRHHHDYPATDVFAGCGRTVVSPVDGIVLELSRTDRWDPESDRGGRRGGKFVSLAGDDRVRYYLSHLSGIRGRIGVGDRVEVGEQLGWVGRTGSARGTSCHLHFGLSPVCRGTGDWRVRRGVVPPYRFLRGWEQGGNHSPARALRVWREAHSCG